MSVTPYKYEQYSIFDIMEFLEQKNMQIIFLVEGSEDKHYIQWRNENNLPVTHIPKFPTDRLQVVGTDVYIQIPQSRDTNTMTSPCIRFHNHPKTKYHEESKKIYESLRRKFGRRKDEHWKDITYIKDFERIQEYVAQQKKRSKIGLFDKIFGS